MTKALIYTRVSQDTAGGRSPAEQEAEARAVCDREGWTVTEVVTDSVGASRHSKGTRAGWARVQRIIEAGQIDVLVTWEASRAQRDLEAYAELRRLCKTHRVLWSYSGRTHDLADSDDRFRTGLDALLAEREADETSDRVRRAMRANAAAGRPHGRRLYGYERVYDPATGRLIGQVPDDDEAPIVRRIFAEYLAGAGVRTVARGLNADGVTTSTGAEWHDSQVKRVLKNAHYAGRRVHRGEVLGATWSAIVDPDTFARVQARLEARRGIAQSSKARLLTGVARCALCAGKLGVGHDRRGRKLYQCRNRFCVARDERQLDAYVTVAVLDRLARPDVTDTLGADVPEVTEARAEADVLRARLDEAVTEFTAGRLSAATLARIEADLTARIAELDRVIRRASVPLDLDDLPGADGVDSWWDSLPVERRREVVAALIAVVVVRPTTRGRRKLDPDSVEITWR